MVRVKSIKNEIATVAIYLIKKEAKTSPYCEPVFNDSPLIKGTEGQPFVSGSVGYFVFSIKL